MRSLWITVGLTSKAKCPCKRQKRRHRDTEEKVKGRERQNWGHAAAWGAPTRGGTEAAGPPPAPSEGTISEADPPAPVWPLHDHGPHRPRDCSPTRESRLDAPNEPTPWLLTPDTLSHDAYVHCLVPLCVPGTWHTCFPAPPEAARMATRSSGATSHLLANDLE